MNAPQPAGIWRRGQVVDEYAAVVDLLGPPPDPVPEVDWDWVGEQLGVTLPADYRAFIDTYGVGRFCDVTVTAIGGDGDFDMFALLQRRVGAMSTDPTTEMGGVFPEPGGVLAWGESPSGWTFGWETGGEPESWSVVASHPAVAVVQFAESGFSGFLRKLVDPGSDLTARLGWRPWPGDRPPFTPA